MNRFLRRFIKLALRISAVAAVAAGIAFIAERIEELKTWGAELRHKPYGIYERFVKRPLDCFLSTGALIVFSPILLVLTVVGAIKMGGNPFFTQERPGRNEKIFKLIKFRSMNNKTDKNGDLLPDSERLTRYGKALRASSLDELPELFNIIKGDMAVVGPRPQLVRDMVFMTIDQRQRHNVRQGLTGLAQINGRNDILWEDKLATDLEYVKKITFLGDVRIILGTVIKVFNSEGITEGEMATAMDYGDYLLSKGQINNVEYDRWQSEAKRLLEDSL